MFDLGYPAKIKSLRFGSFQIVLQLSLGPTTDLSGLLSFYDNLPRVLTIFAMASSTEPYSSGWLTQHWA